MQAHRTRAVKASKICPRYASGEYPARTRIADLPPPQRLTPQIIYNNNVFVERLLATRPELLSCAMPTGDEHSQSIDPSIAESFGL